MRQFLHMPQSCDKISTKAPKQSGRILTSAENLRAMKEQEEAKQKKKDEKERKKVIRQQKAEEKKRKIAEKKSLRRTGKKSGMFLRVLKYVYYGSVYI